VKGVWWLLGVGFVAQGALTAMLGPERAWQFLPWVNAPAAFVASCLAFYEWSKYRRDIRRGQPVPLLPLALALRIYAAGITPVLPDRLRGREALLVFAAVMAWFLIAYVRLLLRQTGAAVSTKRPNDR